MDAGEMASPASTSPSFYTEKEASYYDFYTSVGADDIAMWRALAAQYAGDRPALELGCGTMRVGIALAEVGCAVIGVDKSAAMLRKAREKLALLPIEVRARVKLIETDIRFIDLGRTFQFSCMPLSVLMEFIEESEQLSVLSSVLEHLEPGGILALDIPFLNPERLKNLDPNSRRPYASFCVPDSLVQVTREISVAADLENKTANLTFWTTETPCEESGTTSNSSNHMTVKYLYQDLERLGRLSGFELISIWGDYSGTDIRNVLDPRVQVVLLRRPLARKLRGKKQSRGAAATIPSDLL
jgi:SAM-dependent methyltransferase